MLLGHTDTGPNYARLSMIDILTGIFALFSTYYWHRSSLVKIEAGNVTDAINLAIQNSKMVEQIRESARLNKIAARWTALATLSIFLGIFLK